MDNEDKYLKNREVDSDSTHKETIGTRSTIDGENRKVSPQVLRKEKDRLEAKYEQALENLEKEKREQLQIYGNKVSGIRDDDHYKEEIYQEKINQLLAQKEKEDGIYNEKILTLRREMENAMHTLDTKVAQLNRERDVQLQMIEDRREEVMQEKRKYDELFQLQMEKIQRDDAYEARTRQIQTEQLENLHDHKNRQRDLDKERIYRESNFSKILENEKNNALIKLKEMEGFGVADKDPDVRGWKVVGKNGNELGTIDELIVDKEAMKVRYLDIDLNNEILENGRNKHLLLPIGVAEIDAEDDFVYAPTLDRALVNKVPGYESEQLTRGYEETLINTLSIDEDISTDRNSGDFYDRHYFNDRSFYDRRRE